MSYPPYSRAERIADSTVHVLGIMASLIAVAALFIATRGTLSPGTLAATIIYSVALITMLTASGVYHMAAHTRFRPMLRRIDHAAIYVKIAGTYTPLAVLVGSASGYIILATVWLVAVVGAVRKLLAQRGKIPTSSLPYVALGWIGVILLFPLMKIAPTPALILIATGGLTYMGGVIFYNWQSLRYSTAIWHAFVLIATACFFGAIATSVMAFPG